MAEKKKNWWEEIRNAFKPMEGDVGKESQIAMGLPATVRSSTNMNLTGATNPSATQLGGYTNSGIARIGGAMGGTGSTGQFTGLGGYRPPTQEAANTLATTLGTNTKIVPTTTTETVTETETPTTNAAFTPLFSAEDVLKKQTDLANQVRKYQDLVATNASEEQKRALAQQIRRSELAFQQARQQISEQDFMQQRALMQGAQARGLGGSGLEQLGRTQARMQTGQQLNQLSQQYGDQLQGYLNTQLGIESKLANALAGNALTEMGNINEAELTALDTQWKQMQQNWTIEDRQKFDNEQTATNYIKLYQDLKAAGDNVEDRNALLKTYGDQNLLSKEMITEIENLAVAPAALSAGENMSSVTSNLRGLLRQTGIEAAREKESYDQAMANDEGDGRLSMLTTGSTRLYFPNDTALLAYVKTLYTSRENSNKISIVIEGGKVVYKTPDGTRYNTYNKASDALR
jgi:hypothetical protein